LSKEIYQLAESSTGAIPTGFTPANTFNAATALLAPLVATLLVPSGRPPAATVRHAH
jgi:hypothetical protein